ncbi:MAG: hypothetical protein ACOC4C_04055 [Fibrobacterota bacterium]
MPKFAIAFIVPVEKNALRHSIIESPNKESALKEFFKKNISDFYSTDEQGYFYFKEDFFDADTGAGSILKCND